MSETTPPSWEPPMAGTETEHLLAALERQRVTFRWKADGLDAAGLAARLGTSSMTMGGLLKHLALVEDFYFATKLRGDDLGAEWAAHDGTDDWEFVSAADDAPAELYALYDGAVARSHERVSTALAEGGLDLPTVMTGPDGTAASLRRLLFDLVEEYGRHTGHADLLREAVDGRTGEDAPWDWQPW